MALWTPSTHDAAVALAILIGVAIAALILQRVVFALLGKLARKDDGPLPLVLARAAAPSRFIFPLVAIDGTLPVVSLPERAKGPAEHVLGLLIIAAIAWALIALVQLADDLIKRHYRIDLCDSLHARQIETRVDILARAVITIVVFVSIASALMTFPPIRAIGATLLASAGLIGILAGFAARPIFENLVAGIQIALTQPIRIDDVLIVEGENCRVEKIGATYVVVRIWDLRRMVVPLTYFIDKPFQNWTYDSAALIGSVMLYVAASVPVESLRSALDEILKTAPLWDGAVANVAMTDAKESSVEMRVLVSAANSADLFDLRCYVRERLVAFVRDNHVAGFTSTRIVLAREPRPEGGASSSAEAPAPAVAQAEAGDPHARTNSTS